MDRYITSIVFRRYALGTKGRRAPFEGVSAGAKTSYGDTCEVMSAIQGYFAHAKQPPPQREFKLPWRKAGPPNYHDEKMDSDQ